MRPPGCAGGHQPSSPGSERVPVPSSGSLLGRLQENRAGRVQAPALSPPLSPRGGSNPPSPAHPRPARLLAPKGTRGPHRPGGSRALSWSECLVSTGSPGRGWGLEGQAPEAAAASGSSSSSPGAGGGLSEQLLRWGRHLPPPEAEPRGRVKCCLMGTAGGCPSDAPPPLPALRAASRRAFCSEL